jgi:hypothetical protein
MKTLKIQIPTGYEIDSFDKLTGEVRLKEEKPKKVTERIKTIDDILRDHDLTQSQFYLQCKELEDDEIAYRLLKMLVKSLNEGWTPDWSNSNQYKYSPWFEMGGSSGFRYNDCDGWHTYSNVGSRLCFKSEELAKYAGTQFLALYKRFMTIN